MGTAPDDAFSVLGNETRVEILHVMAEQTGRVTEQETLSFSEIYDNVDVRDSGQFSYHLDKLLDHYQSAHGSLTTSSCAHLRNDIPIADCREHAQRTAPGQVTHE